MALKKFSPFWATLVLVQQSALVLALNAVTCRSSSANTGFPIVNNGNAAPILVSADEWPGVQIAVSSFASDLQNITGHRPTIANYTSGVQVTGSKNLPIIIGTLGHSKLIDTVLNNTKLDVSNLSGVWEAFHAQEVTNPLPGISRAYLMIGADKRGTIFNIYTHSESFGVSPWYWWADVPVTKSSALFASGCSHGEPTVKYRGIFLNDEQPALQNWAQEKFNTGFTSAPFNHLFYTKLFELILRMKGNYLWPAIWSSMFCVDDPLNQPLADTYGIVYGTSHQEPMARSTPNEFNKFSSGVWDFSVNAANITQFWIDGVIRAKPYETLYTMGMRGAGDEPLAEGQNIELLEKIIQTQRDILTNAFPNASVTTIPQMWCLYKEVQGFYEDGMTVPDDITLLWTDDNYGNIRRFPVVNERNRTGGAGVYYHVDYVGSPRDYKWIQSSQIPKIHEQMSLAVERNATRIWILNVGDLKPYERDTEFFLTMGYNASVLTPDNLDSAYVSKWATREFGLSATKTQQVVEIVANLTRFNSRRKPELWNSTTFSLWNYREAETVASQWQTLANLSQQIHDTLPSAAQPAFFQLVNHPVQASANAAQMYFAAGLSNLRASQARLSANLYAEQTIEMFDHDFDFEAEYHSLLGGKWDHMMDQTHLGYVYWQQPMTNSMPQISRVQAKKQALPGPMRIGLEGSSGAWPGDNPNDCAQQFSCSNPTLLSFDPFIAAGNRYIDIAAGGPSSFNWNISADQKWVKFSQSSGSITASHSETRVFVSVDWNNVQGSQTANIQVQATTTGQAPMSQVIGVVANKTSVPAGFHGFVEGDGVISIEAAHTTLNTTVNGVKWITLPGYGRTLSAVTPSPATGNNNNNFTVGAGPRLEYNFINFNTLGNSTLSVTTYVSPSFNGNGNDRPLGFAVQVDTGTPVSSYFMPFAPASTTPPGWDTPDGFAANSIVAVQTNHTHVSPGSHVLRVWMIEPAVVVQKLVIDTGGLRSSYLGPPESVRV